MGGNRRETGEATSQTSVKWRKPAGDGTPFLVIQAIGKKSILRLTSISLLKKRRGKSAQAHSLELPFTNPLIFHLSRVMRGRCFTSFTRSRLSTTRTGRQRSCGVNSQHDADTKHGHRELDAALYITATSVLMKRLTAGLGHCLGPWCRGRRSVRLPAETIGRSGGRPAASGHLWNPTAAASPGASPPRTPAGRRRSDPGVRTTVPSLHCRGRWSSRSRRPGHRLGDR